MTRVVLVLAVLALSACAPQPVNVDVRECVYRDEHGVLYGGACP